MTREQKKEWAIRVGIGVGVAAITTLIVRKNFVSHLDAGANELATRVATSSFSLFGSNHTTVVNAVKNGGYMHKIVRCVETGEWFDKVGDAAESAGVPIAKMSRHINGHIENINDLHYVTQALASG